MDEGNGASAAQEVAVGTARDAASTGKPRGTSGRTSIRWAIIWMAFFGTLIAYLDRANLSVAMPDIVKGFHIGPAAEGLILSSFFWTYALFQFPAGHLIDKIGERFTYALSICCWAVFTGLTAAATGTASLLGFRLGLGAGESAAGPAATKVVSEWFPRGERATASGVWASGAQAGSALSLPVVAVIVTYLGWRWSFLITAAIALVWGAAWYFFYRRPRQHRLASAAEVAYIEGADDAADTAPGAERADAERDGHKEASPTLRWRDLLRYRTVWAMIAGFAAIDFVIYFFITWFPTYLENARGFSLLEVGFYGTIPGIVATACNWAGGLVSDRVYRKTGDVNKARKRCLVPALLCTSVIALAVVVPTPAEALALLSVSYGAGTFAAAVAWTLPADVAFGSDKVGSLASLQNFAGNAAGALGPYLVGALYAATGSFVAPLAIAGGVAILGALAYAIGLKRVEPLR
ncbi:MAG TPA: MFS transporter [Trebonia sp.]|jgi:ACS family glucarate transporter-like MFS transporter